MGDVGAVAKLGHYLLALLGEPRLASWRARKLVEAEKISAHGEAEAMEIRAIGTAKAELAASAMLAKAGIPQSLLDKIEGEIDQRIDTLFEKRLSNLAQIVTKAKDALPPGQVPDVEPDLAWTSSFSEAAQDVSDEEMQEMWARVLAGEVARHGTTSLRTMNVLRNLDQATAQKFRRLCSIAVSITIRAKEFDNLVVSLSLDHRVVSLEGYAGENSLLGYGLSYDVLNLLNEHELIIADYNSQQDYRYCNTTQRADGLGRESLFGFRYQGQQWAFVPDGERDQSKEFNLSGVALTRAGKELSRVVELEAVPEYDEALRGYFAKQGLTMTRLSQP